MKVNFEKTLSPCVCNEVILWHIAHGFVWNVREVSGRYIGVFYATLLCGDGVIVHFSSVPGIPISAASVFSAFKKGVRIVAPLGVVFATIPESKRKLISAACRLGFVRTSAAFHRFGDGNIALLKFLKNENGILNV